MSDYNRLHTGSRLIPDKKLTTFGLLTASPTSSIFIDKIAEAYTKALDKWTDLQNNAQHCIGKIGADECK